MLVLFGVYWAPCLLGLLIATRFTSLLFLGVFIFAQSLFAFVDIYRLVGSLADGPLVRTVHMRSIVPCFLG